MKHIKIIILIALLAGYLPALAQKTSKEEVAPELVEAREKLKAEIITTYTQVKTDLVLSDSVSVKKSALTLVDLLKKFKFKKLTLDEMNSATTSRAEMIGLADSVAGTLNINIQRKNFAKLSVIFWALAPKLKPANITLYQQVCPMTGESWISDSKEIKNPYYPKNMLTCGEVKATL